MLRNFRTYHIAVEFYRIVVTLRLQRHLRDQLIRAASSAALNCAEGAGKSSKRDQARFFEIAFASTKESQAVLELSGMHNHPACACADKLVAHLYRLIQSCKR